jgi:PIN domain nuclease of toxin-antitoxin system
VDLLLDTHAFIWWAARDSRLVENARIAIADADNRVVVSAASVWEISIKRASGKLASSTTFYKF